MLKTKADIDRVQERARTYGITHAEAQAEDDAINTIDTERLAEIAPEHAAEISKALEALEAESERVENMRAEHEATLSGITGQIFLLGNVRRRIAIAKSLALDEAGTRYLAHTTLNYFVEKKMHGETVQNATGFRSTVEDLSFRQCLNNHITAFVAPLESQVLEIVKAVKAEAKSAKIDLKKVLAMLRADRGVRGGEALDLNSDFYAGLI
jgi:tRNA A37 N6-isopentenylltransferase MiaA